MIPRLVWRSLVRRPGRSALLLAGYALGVAVTVALLSIGSALLRQARDRELVGGGDLAVLPAGIDLETLKTGGVSSLYFTIDQAPFLYRQVLAGPRFDDRIEAAAPWIDDELVYLGIDGRTHAVSAGGRIPSLSRRLGVRPEVTAGAWEDHAADRRWRAPGDSALYAGMDHFHLPSGEAAADSTWAEWHYFNVRLPGGDGAGTGGWLYLTYMVTGEVPDGRWGGRLLATLVTPAPGAARMRVRTWEARVPAREVTFSLVRPDLAIGPASVALDSTGTYRIDARIPARGGPPLRVELAVRADGRRHLPPLEAAGGDFPSGYTVPVLDGRASGRICAGGACRRLEDAPAYHDHNWGVWRGVTWDWGQARAGPYSAVWGGVRRGAAHRRSGGRAPGRGPARPPDAGGGDAPAARASGGRFLFLADTLGFLGLFPVDSLAHRWRPSTGGGGRAVPRPGALGLVAARPPDTVRLEADVRHVRAARGGRAGALFYQMEGEVRLRGRVLGRRLRAAGRGFFETWRRSRPDSGRTDARDGGG